ncbi:MAG: ABC transporter ATP-binding protein [Bariatricus sp.]
MENAYVKLQNLTVGYHGKPLIRDICIEIQKGEIVTLIGPNGAGKSTILKSITRQIKMLGGNVSIADERIDAMENAILARKMAVVLTERMKTELMTCRDVVETGRYPYTGRLGILTKKDKEIVEEAMEAVHVRELENQNFQAISDGQRQRIMLARAICQEPEVLVLDEPTSYLDIHYKLELLSMLRKLAKEKKITVVMSLHEIDLAQKISDKILCVKGDKIFDYGKPEEVFQEEVIRELYGIDNGSYDPCFGSIELPKPEGEPSVLVISACGTGIPVYRKLQKENIPFAAGILYRNDVDYHVAKRLAAKVIVEEPFCLIRDAAYQEAKEMINSCQYIINAGVSIGEGNRRMAELLCEAQKSGKLCEWKEGSDRWKTE